MQNKHPWIFPLKIKKKTGILWNRAWKLVLSQAVTVSIDTAVTTWFFFFSTLHNLQLSGTRVQNLCIVLEKRLKFHWKSPICTDCSCMRSLAVTHRLIPAQMRWLHNCKCCFLSSVVNALPLCFSTNPVRCLNISLALKITSAQQLDHVQTSPLLISTRHEVFFPRASSTRRKRGSDHTLPLCADKKAAPSQSQVFWRLINTLIGHLVKSCGCLQFVFYGLRRL